MQALFRKALQRILGDQLGLTAHTSSAMLAKAINERVGFDLSYSRLARLPANQVQNAMKVPCPGSGKINAAQIVLFKRARHYFHVEQSAVCRKCERECPFRGLGFKEMPEKPTTGNKSGLHDLIFYLGAMSQRPEEEYSALRWGSAYRVALALDTFLTYSPALSAEALLMRQVLKYQEEQERRKSSPKLAKQQQEERTRKSLATRRIVL